MTGCSAPNCHNQSKNGYKLYRFPADVERRKKWLINCRRQNWSPTQNDRLCSAHFQDCQFEQHREDGKRKLLPFAVPTIFDVPNPPKLLNISRRSTYKRPREQSKVNEPVTSKRIKLEVCATSSKSSSMALKDSQSNTNDCVTVVGDNLMADSTQQGDIKDTKREVSELQKTIAELQEQLKTQNEALSRFLTNEQIAHLCIERKCIKKWSSKDIVKSLKLRFALGKNGYNFLRETGYPAPSYSTINKRVSAVKVDFGLLQSIIDLLSKKVEMMTQIEKDCSLMIDEMEISGDLDFDKSKNALIGQVTLGDKSKRGTHLTVVTLRGLNSPWKQIIACHVTGPSTSGNDMKQLISQVIHAATFVGLNVVSTCSDMGSNNKAMWASLGICVNRDQRNTKFKLDILNNEISILADGPHLLKNWKLAIQNSQIYIPMEVVKEHNLPTNVISGKYIMDLWNEEMKNKKCLRSLHHLTEEIVTPGHFSKMNVGYAMRYISVKTAAALETAVIQKILPTEALTTAWFLRLLRQWFELINSRRRVTSITSKNFGKKEEFINYFITVIEQTVIGKGWKPLNTGSILTSISFISIAKACFERGYKFLLGSRLSQDALENIFSQIRKKAGMKPSALAALRAIKLICLSQYMSDTKNTNYCTDSDLHLLDYSELGNENDENQVPILQSSEVKFTPAEKVNIHYIAGSCVHFLLKHKNICDICKILLIDEEGCNEGDNMTLTECLNLGGLKSISTIIYSLFEEAELIIQSNLSAILETSLSFNKVFEGLKTKYSMVFPQCCNILNFLVEHYATVRGMGIKSFEICKKKTGAYGSKSVYKKTYR